MTVRLRWLALLAGFFLLMVSVGSIPGQAIALSQRLSDKLLHALAYGFMAGVCFRALVASPAWRALATIGAIGLLGMIDEFLQSLLPYRNASLTDWCFDIGSAITVTVLLLLFSGSTLPKKTHAKN